jgi:fermentation-respiration switch protein FrsA (DUF1100 family)
MNVANTGASRPAWKTFLSRSCLMLSGSYVGILVVLLALEDWMLYHPSGAAEWCPPPEGIQVKDVSLRSADGTRLHGWWATPPAWKPSDGATLFCHGNGGNVSFRRDVFRPFLTQMRQGLLVFDYPGFGCSGGRPSEAGCYVAGEAAYQWLTEVQQVPGRRVLLYGGSLGGGIATDLATRLPCRALFLVAAFTSFPDMAQKEVPWLPARFLVHNGFNNLQKIACCRVPVFIAHSPDDGLIPFSQGQRLFAAAATPKRFFPMPGAWHNDLPREDVYPALRQFLDEMAAD